MYQFCILDYLHGVNDLGDDESVEVQGLSLIVVLLDEVEDGEREQLEDYAEMLPEDEEVEHPDNRVFAIGVVYSVKLMK